MQQSIKICLSVWVLALLSLIPENLPAADFYIAQSGTGSAIGTSCLDAHAYTWFNTAANWNNGAGTINPGDTVHVCGTITGSAGASILTFQGSGTSGSPITLRFETGAGLSAPYCASAVEGAGCITMSNATTARSYLVVDGGLNTPCGWNTATNSSEGTCNGYITNTANGSQLAYDAFSSGIEMDACTDCEVKNILIYNLYQSVPGTSVGNVQQQNCINFSGSNNQIHDSCFHDAGWCLANSFSNGDTNNKVYNNDIYQVAHGMFNSSSGPKYATNFYFYGNYVHDYQNFNDSGYHTDGIHTYGISDQNNNYPLLTGFYVYNNIFGGNSGDSLSSQVYISANSYSLGSDSTIHNAAIFNNVLEVSGEVDNGILCVGGGNENVAYNNTIVNTGATVAGVGFNWSNISPAGFTLTFENLAIQNATNLIASSGSGGKDTGITADHNAYAQCIGGNCMAAFIPGNTSNWASYLANSYGQEQHSVAVIDNSNLLTATGNLGLDSSFRPQAGSILISGGANLSSLCTKNGGSLPDDLCSDIAGNPRPSTGSWDIGAYQYMGGLSPPTGLTLVQ
jgi:hypothetical protein